MMTGIFFGKASPPFAFSRPLFPVHYMIDHSLIIHILPHLKLHGDVHIQLRNPRG
jgi:hypothetical protein